ncbi:RagB/SusD family nutrient uptake outer membrane protein [Chitinophaga sp. Cy-1792]|uniref:RagB/SusD family nutrient uptake outer membrane protein n=1 Tax=Chitinophaga sp. Cy-1792 TaxID=2608339 RepID=UPI00141DF4F4|nr:RagB/SusD family nutrient uptake outer membrane protein [Chitinophaga sp. Cy-1792]NIG56778.1 RagB/SusD family nutrient uptake outer membrane protein [Chitinophaga sp. Cy-1792]
MTTIHKKYTSLTTTVLLLLLLAISACKKDLDTSPLTTYSNETFWTSEQNAMIALTGVYRGNIQMNKAAEFTATDWWSYYGLLFQEFASDNAYDRRGDNSAINRLSNGTMTNDLGVLGEYWSASYTRIARANYFLENVAKTPVSKDKLARLTAEARFLRACTYFYMSQFWQSVPLVTRSLSAYEANHVLKAPKDSIVQFVIDELNAAVADLPQYKDLASTERGRASKQAALAFLGRLYLSEKKYAQAASTYKQIIDYNDNIIDPDYAGLFNGSNETSKEIIFATQYVVDYGSNAMLQHMYPAVAGGWHLYCPLGSLVESYEFNDGTPFSFTDARYNPNDLGAGRDPRLKLNILYNGNLFKNLRYVSHPDSVSSSDQLTTTKQATRTGFCIRKYNSETFTGDLQNSGIDLPVIRYAEVLLSYLEAKLEAGDAIDQSLLDATINKVRGRAAVNMPPVKVTDAATLRPVLRRERRNELAMEGLRYWDLLRWGIAAQVLKGDFYGAPFPNAKNLRKNAAGTVDPYSRWYVTSKAFRAGTDEKWPVPLSEVNINPKLQ